MHGRPFVCRALSACFDGFSEEGESEQLKPHGGLVMISQILHRFRPSLSFSFLLYHELEEFVN